MSRVYAYLNRIEEVFYYASLAAQSAQVTPLFLHKKTIRNSSIPEILGRTIKFVIVSINVVELPWFTK